MASAAYFTDVTTTNVEVINVTGTAGNDLLIYKGGTTYDGKAGTDTFYADWSAATTDISWLNDPTKTQTANDVSVAGMERLLIQTGSGNDNISNTTVATNDEIFAGAGNDTISEKALAGTVQADTIDGGLGTDTFNLDLTADTHSLGYVIYNAAGAGTALYSDSSLGAIQTALSAQDALAKTNFFTGTSVTTAYYMEVMTTGFEVINLIGAAGNDLLIYKNGASYDGKTGTDTFYAELECPAQRPSVWTNTGAAFTYNGTTVSNVERLLLQTGSGNDAIDNSAFATNDEIVTGTGNDTINAGAGSDRVDAGGNDDVVGEVAVFNASQTDVVDGGSGTDTLNLDMSAGNAQSLRYVVYNAAGAGTALDYTPPWERFRPLWPLKMRRPRQI